VATTGANFNSVADREVEPSSPSRAEADMYWRSRFTVVLDKIDHVPGMMALTQLLQRRAPDDAKAVASSSTFLRQAKHSELFVDALRLIELSDRTSAVMKSSAADTLLHTDPLLGIFRMFGELNDLPVSTSLSIVTYDELAYSVVDHARENQSQLILLPSLSPTFPTSETDANVNVNDGSMTPKNAAHSHNPFDALFRSGGADRSGPATHSQFVRGVFSQAKTDVALFVDQGHAPGAISAQHVFLPFFGGPDDRLALEFVVQLCANPKLSATVIRIEKREVEVGDVRLVPPAHLGEEKNGAAGEQFDHGFTVTSVDLCCLPPLVCGLMLKVE
jgi:hypothetical protein